MPNSTVEFDFRGNTASLEASTAKAKAALSSVGSSASSASSKMNSFASKASAFGSKMSSAGKSLTRNVSLPLVGLGAVAVKTALDFEQSFTRIHALSSGLSSKEIEKFKGTVLSLAGKTAQAPEELANALFFLSSAGLQTKQIGPVLAASAKAAAAGMGETETIAKITSQALNAYASSGLKAATVTDNLTAAITAGSAEPDEFAGALGRILPIAVRAGVSFDEVTASLAGLSNVGTDVNEGVTAMRGLLSALEAPGTQAAKTMKQVGISADEMRTAISDQGILGAMRLLDKATGGNIDQMRKIVPNIRALTGQFALTGQKASKVNEVFHNVKNSTGALDKAFKETQKGSAFQMQRSLNRLRIEGIKLGEKLIPVAQKIVDAISKAAKWFGNLSDAQKENALKWAAVAVAAGPVLRIFGGLASSIGAITKGGSAAVKVLAKIGATQAATSAAGSAAGSVATGVGGAAAGTTGGAVAGTAGATAGAGVVASTVTTAGVLAAGVLARAGFQKITEEEKEAGGALKFFGTAAQLAQGAIDKLNPGLGEQLTKLGQLAHLIPDASKQTKDLGKSVAEAYPSISKSAAGFARLGVAIPKTTQAEVNNALAMGHAKEAAKLLAQAFDFASQKTTMSRGSLDLWNNTLRAGKGFTADETAKTFDLIGKMDALGGSLTDAQKKHVQAAIAAGNYKRAVDILSGAVRKLSSDINHVPTRHETVITANTRKADETLSAWIARLRQTVVHVNVQAITGQTFEAPKGVPAPNAKHYKAARGFNGRVNSPTLFLTGEQGEEDVTITPRGKRHMSSRSGANIQVNVTNDTEGKKIARELDWLARTRPW